MNYQKFKNDSLIMLYENIRTAVAADGARKAGGKEIHLRVGQTSDFKKRANVLETEMLRRGMTFEAINSSGG